MMAAMRAVSVLCVVLVAVAGCSSGGTGHPDGSSTSHRVSSVTVPAFRTDYGQDAALVATHISGCTDVAAKNIGDAPGVVSSATCSMLGHVVVIYTLATAADESSLNRLTAGDFAFYASGIGWNASLGDDAAPDAQKAISTVVARALGGTVNTGTG